MEKIFEIAKGITNPYSLLALTYLILFVLFRGVLGKAGQQHGEKAYRIIRYLMTLVAVIATLTLLSVFALRAFEVQQGATATVEQVNRNTQADVQAAVSKLSAPDLQVEYALGKNTGAWVVVGNRGQGIILVSNLTVHWDYRACPRFKPPYYGNPVVTYRYSVDLTKSQGSKGLDHQLFKYGPGDVDKFQVDLGIPDYGIYTVWLTFTYRNLGDTAEKQYETEHLDKEACVKARTDD